MGKKRKHSPAVTDEDLVIHSCREWQPEILERLREVALANPPKHQSIAAAKLICELAEKQTSQGRDPFGVLNFPTP